MGGSPNGVETPDTKEPGQPKGCPARATITLQIPAALEATSTQVNGGRAPTKNHAMGAWVGSFVFFGVSLPAADFAAAPTL